MIQINLSRKTKILITLAFMLVVVAAGALYKARQEEKNQKQAAQPGEAASVNVGNTGSLNDSVTAQGDGSQVDQKTLESVSSPALGKNKNTDDVSSQKVIDSITAK